MSGAEFKAARERLGYTQKELAERLRMGAHGWQSVSAWENGHQPVPGPIITALEGVLYKSFHGETDT